METFSFIHAADLHLDTPFEGIAADAPEIQHLLVDASLHCWDSLVSLAIERRAAFVLLAGDLYDGAERGIRAQFRVKAGLDRLSSAGIQTLIVHGNHDPLAGWTAAGSFAPEVTVFGSTDVERQTVTRDGVTLAHVYGISFGKRDVTENLSLRFHRRNDEGLHIGLLHCTVGSSADHASYSPCALEDLRMSGMDYWALGHIHKRHTLSRGSPWVVYPGNLQGRSAKASEQGAKGALLIDVLSGLIQEPTFVPLDCVRFVEAKLDISAIDSMSFLHDQIADEVSALQGAHDGRALIARVVLEGRAPLHRELADASTMRELKTALRDMVEGSLPLVWIEGVRNETSIPIDRDAIIARGDFSSELLRSIDVILAEPSKLDALIGDQMSPATRRRLASLGIDFGHEDVKAILTRAESLALDLLEAEAAG